jgi:hypothetical protein
MDECEKGKPIGIGNYLRGNVTLRGKVMGYQLRGILWAAGVRRVKESKSELGEWRQPEIVSRI